MNSALPSAMYRFPTAYLLESPPLSGAENMALDEALAAGIGDVDAGFVLRFYRWSKPTISIGRHSMPWRLLSRDALEKSGLCVVRRPSGGGAVLHQGDLTFAAASRRKAHPRDVFRSVASAVGKGLRELGVEAELLANRSSPHPDGLCFEVHVGDEITVGGKKLVGIATRVYREAVLVHGSIPVTSEYRLLREFLLPEEAGSRSADSAVSINELLSSVPDWSLLCDTLTRGFESELGRILSKKSPDESILSKLSESASSFSILPAEGADEAGPCQKPVDNEMA